MEAILFSIEILNAILSDACIFQLRLNCFDSINHRHILFHCQQERKKEYRQNLCYQCTILSGYRTQRIPPPLYRINFG